MQYLVNPQGKYLGTLVGSAEVIFSQTPPDHTTTLLPPPRSTDYWNGSEWIDIGLPPTHNHVYDYGMKQWIDSRPLEQTKKVKWEEIKQQRNLIEIGGFMFQGRKFDSDHISQTRMLAAVVMGQPITWTLADDTSMELSANELMALGVALANHVTNTHARGRVARQLIDQALTNTEVDAVVL